MQKQFKSLSVIGVVMALWAAMCTVGRASPLDDRVPSDAIFYLGWSGSTALAPQYAQSNIKNIIDASSVQKFVEEQLPKLIDQATNGDPKAKDAIIKLQTGLGILWRHPAAFYFSPVDFTNIQQPVFRFGVVCDAGDDSKMLVALLADALQNIPPMPQLPINVVQDGNVVVVTFGKADTAADLKAGGGLKAVPAYVKAMGQMKGINTPAMGFYIDFQKALAMVDDGVAKAPLPVDVRTKVTAVIDALGVRSLTQAASLSGFDGKGWMDQGFCGVSGPKTGLLALMDSPPISDEALASVPKDAVMMSTSSLDLMKIYTEARAVTAKIDPTMPAQLDDIIKQGNEFLGIDIVKDLIASMGTEVVVYRAPLSDAGPSTALVMKLKDGNTFAATLAKLETVFNEKSGSPIKVEKVKAGKQEVSMVAFLSYNVCWTVRNGYLYVSSLDGIPGAIAQVENKGPNITANDDYKKAMAKMPAGIKPTMISYSNPAKTYPEIRALALGVIPMLRGQGINVPMDILPDPTAVSEFMTPGAEVTWTDGTGIHVYSTSAFPGAALVGGQTTGATSVVAVGAVGAAVLLPSLGKSRELAIRAADAANLRGIAQSCVVWSMDHNNDMPDHLGRLLVDGMISPRSLSSKRGNDNPMVMTPELEKMSKDNFGAFAAEVDKHADYVYVGKGMKNTTDADLVIAYEKPSAGTLDGINVAFADAHAEFIRWASVPQTFAATNAYLKKNGLPEINIDALMKKAPFGGGMVAPAPTGNPGGLP